ncbi:phytanoyl-CoA dioxygenase family protein [Alphaproteobacteria bacterium]|nr:phytanoyl-CoA dioxygenase family protein [Alphaproteobacteria bacterium]MDC1209344.1 phytanoyl-CoA dioxygenase family protein [Pseudomonadota bacterium]
MATVLNKNQTQQFRQNGFVIVNNFFNEEETKLLQNASIQDPSIRNHLYDRADSEGLVTKMIAWNHPDDSIYGVTARSEKIVDTMEDLLGGEVYHYHSKITAKEPFEGGAWEWHQDYGYWYNNGCLFPLMATAMIALDKCTKENGCLQVLSGSNNLGRIDHALLESGQVGVDLKRVDEAKKCLELVYCEMEPGDVLFFHCNTLHRSDKNNSPDRRWTLLCCYNAARNNPFLDHHHPKYTPLKKLPNSAIIEAGDKFLEIDNADGFLNRPTAPPGLTKKAGKVFNS